MNAPDLMKEMALFIAHTELTSTFSRNNHASNYMVLKGALFQDKEKLRQAIQYAIANPGGAEFETEWERRF